MGIDYLGRAAIEKEDQPPSHRARFKEERLEGGVLAAVDQGEDQTPVPQD